MKDKVTFDTEITQDALRELVQFMRPLDKREICDDLDCGDAGAFAVLMDGITHSTHCATFSVNGELCGIFGIRPINMAQGVYMPWMLTTQAFARHRVSIMKAAKKVIAMLQEVAKELRVAVPAFYPQAVGWLKHQGFTISEPINRFGRVFYLCQKKVEV